MRCFRSLRGRKAFTTVMGRGHRASSPTLSLFALTHRRDAANVPEVGIVITKKVGKAVTRNQLRRRCKAILEGSPQSLAPKRYVLHCRPKAAALSFAELRRQLMDVLARVAS
ncbi:MAG: ribonuclease P protein component [Candidatus Eremiobacteraeota bacterium]|nr:ribonuclease P protein component [Candidatus Eremiobacteraeota bacterium]